MLVASMTLGFAIPAPAQSPGAHVHGRAVLEIAVDSEMVQLDLHSPLDNLLGFEHAPRTGEERRAAQAMAAKLHQGDNLFVFTPSARCQLKSTHLKSAALSPDLLTIVPPSGKGQGAAPDHHGGKASKPAPAPSSPNPHAHDAHEGHGTHGNHETDEVHGTHGAHGELEAAWVFHCSAPQALQDLDVGLFRAFSRLRRLDVALAGPRKQSSARLTPQSSRLQWR